MNEKLSALMDGELDHHQARTVIKSLGCDEASRAHWDVYHVIGEVLRGDDLRHGNVHDASTNAIFAALALEPTVLTPQMIKQPVEKRTRIALAMAASVITISAVGVVAIQQQNGQVSTVQLVQQVAPKPVSVNKPPPTTAEVRVNDYLVVHRQFSNPGAFQPAALSRDARGTSLPLSAGK
ncbi:MAG: sigma-E factor negative regulatory protein [Burkholderiales bacterium]|nr:sigma-E factor negative regulatory protein [Burkholderiales bacterium]